MAEICMAEINGGDPNQLQVLGAHPPSTGGFGVPLNWPPFYTSVAPIDRH